MSITEENVAGAVGMSVSEIRVIVSCFARR